MAYIVAVWTSLESDVVNVRELPTLICETYFSGTENVIFIWLVFTNLAIGVSGVTKVPSEIERKPIVPKKGALTVVLYNWAAINSDSARADSKSALEISYSSWLMACFSRSNFALLWFSDANSCAVLAFDSWARSSISFTLNNTWPLDTFEPSSKLMLSTTPETSLLILISSLASKVPERERLSSNFRGFRTSPCTVIIVGAFFSFPWLLVFLFSIIR